MTIARIPVAAGDGYEVVVGPGVLGQLALKPSEPDGERAAVLCDTTVERLHLVHLGPAAMLPRLALPPGEGSKSLATLERVLDFLVHSGLDRSSTLVAFGGGVIGDVGGLAAALYMRGIACLQCPTTLLAQVDSSVGGKTGVNLRAGKNLAGVVHQPRLVLADTRLLATLPEEELASGLGEVVKSALIGDEALLTLLEHEAEGVRARDEAVLTEVVARCVRVKAAIVSRDEHEDGERKLLNLGHTFAHGIEQAAGYGRIPHGIAVGVGLGLALAASARGALLEEPELIARVARLLARLGLPPDLAALRKRYKVRLAPDKVVAGMQHDKKGRAGRPAFVLVRGLGQLLPGQELGRELDERTLLAVLA
jgi:3-dehydroquinate synthase